MNLRWRDIVRFGRRYFGNAGPVKGGGHTAVLYICILYTAILYTAILLRMLSRVVEAFDEWARFVRTVGVATKNSAISSCSE